MKSFVSVKAQINSSCEDALGWKCCNLQGMNLEIQVANTGVKYVWVRSEVVLVGDRDQDKVEYLYPHGTHPLAPDQVLSFYCTYDEHRFKRFSHIVVMDREGRRHQAAITGRHEPAGPEPR